MIAADATAQFQHSVAFSSAFQQYTYPEPLRGLIKVRLLFHKQSSILMRIIKYSNNTFGIITWGTSSHKSPNITFGARPVRRGELNSLMDAMKLFGQAQGQIILITFTRNTHL